MLRVLRQLFGVSSLIFSVRGRSVQTASGFTSRASGSPRPRKGSGTVLCATQSDASRIDEPPAIRALAERRPGRTGAVLFSTLNYNIIGEERAPFRT